MKLSAHCSFRLFALVMVCISILPLSQSYAQADSASVRNLALKKEAFFMKHQVALDNYSFSDPMVNLKLHETMRYKRKSNTKLIIGTAIAALGLAAFISGATTKEEPLQPGEIRWDFGPSISDEAIGGILIAGSLPFFLMAESSRAKMKRSAAEAKRLLIQ